MSREIRLIQAGQDRGRGNIVAIQPQLHGPDYRSKVELVSKLTELIMAAAENRLLTPKTILVFPEYIGLFLYLTDEWPWVHHAATLEQAGRRAILDEKIWLYSYALKYDEDERAEGIRAEMMRVKAPAAAKLYHSIFSTIAKEFGVTVVAGSIPLPGPQIEQGRIAVDRSAHPMTDMQNVCGVYLPGGLLHNELIVKRHPTMEEARSLWVMPQPAVSNQVVKTPAGRLGVLICADAWHPDSYDQLVRPEVLAVPSAILTGGAWQAPWTGYDTVNEPIPDHDPADVGQISLAQAWRKYALLAKGPATGAEAGVTTFIRGPLWDQPTSGVVHGFSHVGPVSGEARHNGAQVVGIWI